MSDERPPKPTPGADPSSLKGLTMAVGIQPADPGQDPLLGRDIGGVTIVRLIAEGGMGRVYEGLQDSPRRTVAVKVMRPGFVSREASQRFGMELEILGRLRHPYIAQIYSAGMCDVVGSQVPFFIMEYIPDALPLTRYATEKMLGIDARIALLQKVCEAVAHGHQQGIVHRDLKPGNILVEPTGIPKIIDFGIARTVGDSPEQMTALTEMGRLIGTLQYMSPEQIAADPAAIDQRTDVYALGVILYELLTGARPYEISNQQIFEAARIIRQHKPVSPRKYNRNLRPDVVRITGTCLQKDRAKRFANAADLASALGRYLAHEAVVDVPRRSVDRRRLPVRAFVATMTLVACVGGVIYGARSWSARPAVRPSVPDPDAEPVFLADLPVVSRKSHFYNNKTSGLIGGKRYANAIHIHPEGKSAQSQLVFAIEGKYDELLGAIGVRDEARQLAAPQVFRIVGDGKELWSSAPFKQTGRGEDFRVDVSGVKTLELQAICKGSQFDAHCVWIDPRLVKHQAMASARQAVVSQRDESGPRDPRTRTVLEAMAAAGRSVKGVAADYYATPVLGIDGLSDDEWTGTFTWLKEPKERDFTVPVRGAVHRDTFTGVSTDGRIQLQGVVKDRDGAAVLEVKYIGHTLRTTITFEIE